VSDEPGTGGASPAGGAASPNPYDAVAYPSRVFAKTHPDRLATIATLCGLRAAPPDRCRTLELGCGDGTNLISCALGTPRSEYVGVDLAASPVARGNAAAAELGARNVRLLAGDLAQPDPAWGTFDYVVAHGVYSWVPPPVRAALLATVAKVLRPGGIAYVSFHAQPGGTAVQMLRETMRFHAGPEATPEELLERSIEFLRVALAARTRPDDPWDRWLRAELAQRVAYDPGTLRHDDLSECNDPVWFHEFAGHAERHGMKYLAEADWAAGRDVHLPQQVQSVLDRMEPRVVREQYSDLVRLRRFRQSLLVHASAAPAAKPCIDRIERLQVAADAGAPNPEVPLDRDGRERFPLLDGTSWMETEEPIARAACRVMRDSSPAPVPFRFLLAESSARLVAAGRRADRRERDRQRAALLEFIAAGHDFGRIQLSTFVPAYEAVPGPRPLACPLARRMARAGRRVVSRLQRVTQFHDDVGPRVISLLDGTRDRAALLAELGAAAQGNEAIRIDPERLETLLRDFGRRGLLIG
jgi:SAM-dependent methyltransferase